MQQQISLAGRGKEVASLCSNVETQINPSLKFTKNVMLLDQLVKLNYRNNNNVVVVQRLACYLVQM